MRSIYVDPVKGRDGAAGSSQASAVRTLSEAWGRVPQRQLAPGEGVKIVLMPGEITEEMVGMAAGS